jgi:hypothetical protein
VHGSGQSVPFFLPKQRTIRGPVMMAQASWSFPARTGDLTVYPNSHRGVACPVSSEQFANLNASSSVGKLSRER